MNNIFEAIESVKSKGCDTAWEPEKPCQPTTAKPGSAEKLAVLRDRLEAGQELWHKDDEKCFAHPCAPGTLVAILSTSQRVGRVGAAKGRQAI